MLIFYKLLLLHKLLLTFKLLPIQFSLSLILVRALILKLKPLAQKLLCQIFIRSLAQLQIGSLQVYLILYQLKLSHHLQALTSKVKTLFSSMDLFSIMNFLIVNTWYDILESGSSNVLTHNAQTVWPLTPRRKEGFVLLVLSTMRL